MWKLVLEHGARDPPRRRLRRDDDVGIRVGLRKRRLRAGVSSHQGEHGAGLVDSRGSTSTLGRKICSSSSSRARALGLGVRRGREGAGCAAGAAEGRGGRRERCLGGDGEGEFALEAGADAGAQDEGVGGGGGVGLVVVHPLALADRI